MRVITILFLLALIVGITYFLVPVEKIQMKAKQTVQDMQAKSPSHNLGGITSKLSEVLSKEDVLNEGAPNGEIANESELNKETAKTASPQPPTQATNTTTPAE